MAFFGRFRRFGAGPFGRFRGVDVAEPICQQFSDLQPDPSGSNFRLRRLAAPKSPPLREFWGSAPGPDDLLQAQRASSPLSLGDSDLRPGPFGDGFWGFWGILGILGDFGIFELSACRAPKFPLREIGLQPGLFDIRVGDFVADHVARAPFLI